jgi:predicted methyltransferase
MRTLILAALLAAVPMSAIAQPANVAAAVAAKDRAEADSKLDDSRQPAKVLSFLGLAKGDRVLDFMAGAGYYSEIMARAVGPRGFVLAWNPRGFAGSERVTKAWAGIKGRVANVGTYVSDLPDISLAPASFDFAMLHLVYHDAYWESAEFKFPRADPDVALAKLFRAMKPGGIVGVVDHVGNAGDTRAIVEATHRIDPETVKADFARAGFVLDGTSDVLRMTGDDYAKSVFDPALRGKTDRVVFRFVKPVGSEAAARPDADACGAGRVASAVGKRLDAALREQLQRESSARAMRIYKTGDPVTMDFNPTRLNVETDAAGTIVAVSCG